MSKLDYLIDHKIIQNLFIWFFFFLILLTTIQADNRALTSLFIILLLAPAIYINNLVVLPFLKKNKTAFLSLFCLNVILFTGVSVLSITTIGKQKFRPEMFVNFFGIMLLAMIFGATVKIARDSFIRRQEEKEAELKLLKAQLNPHFLFNTLNNLYGLSVVKSNKLPDLMLKLSDLLRYSLYETKEAIVPLEKEITYLENYISLEKIRLEDKTTIQFIKRGDLVYKTIAPMLLIVFVENAFKHLGILETEKSKVSIFIEEKNGKLIFTCENTLDEIHLNKIDLEQGKSGIGLQNAKKRLALMYPEKHHLIINKSNNIYCVKLTIDL